MPFWDISWEGHDDTPNIVCFACKKYTLGMIFKTYSHSRFFFKREASDFLSFQWILVYSVVEFRLVIFQVTSEMRKKSLALKGELYPFKWEYVSILGSKTTLKIINVNKINCQDRLIQIHKNRSLQKNCQCEQAIRCVILPNPSTFGLVLYINETLCRQW